MAVFSFDIDELEGIAPPSAQEQYLKKFGYTPPPLPEGYSHQIQHQADTQMTPPPSPGRASSVAATAHTQDGGFGLSNGGGDQVNKLVAKRKTKKRVQLSTFGNSVPSASVPSAANSPSVPSASTAPKSNGRSFHEIAGIIPSRPAVTSPLAIEASTSSASFGAGRFNEESTFDLVYPPDDIDMDTEVQISAIDTQSSLNKGKRKSSAMDFPDDRPSKARTLGGDRVRENTAVQELSGPVPVRGGTYSTAGRLDTPPILSYLKETVEGSEDIFEARNSDKGEASEVIFLSGKQIQWLDYISSPVLLLAATSLFCATCHPDGSVNVYSHNGRRYFSLCTYASHNANHRS